MAHYYLNVINGVGLARDEEGHDYPDLAAAREQAVLGVRSILSEELKSTGVVDLCGRVEIIDAHGSLLMSLPFREAIEFRSEPPSRE